MKRYILLLVAFFLLTSTHNPKPKVLIIGDSIAGGYSPYVQELLKDEADVIKNKGNAEYTGTGIIKIDEWLGEENWDVIQFNWGLWDMYGWRYEDTLRTPEIYAKNLEILVSRLEETGAKLIWATTTPVCPQPEVHNLAVISNETEKAFRKAALHVIKKHNIQVNDLYATIKPIRNKYAIGDHDVHYTSDGYKILAEQVADEILKNLK